MKHIKKVKSLSEYSVEEKLDLIFSNQMHILRKLEFIKEENVSDYNHALEDNLDMSSTTLDRINELLNRE